MKTTFTKVLITLGMCLLLVLAGIFIPYYIGVFIAYLDPPSGGFSKADYWGVGFIILIIITFSVMVFSSIYSFVDNH